MQLPPDPDFDKVVAGFDTSGLQAAYRQAEQHYDNTFREGGYYRAEVVEHAWNKLDAEQKKQALWDLFNAYDHQTQAIRKWVELQDMAPEHNTYLQPGDLEIIEDTLSGALAMETFGTSDTDGPPRSLDEIFPGGMLPIDSNLLQRLISELELLRHRQAMATKQAAA